LTDSAETTHSRGQMICPEDRVWEWVYLFAMDGKGDLNLSVDSRHDTLRVDRRGQTYQISQPIQILVVSTS